MTDIERYALNDGGESSLNEGIEALVSDLDRCQQDLATARENYITARNNYRDSQCEIAAFYVTLATALDLPVETPATDMRARLWQALRERAALVGDLERVTAERDDALDEAKAADLHRDLNRRVAGALGLLDERMEAETGEAFLPSWHDMPEQVTALRAEVERMTAANEELRLTLAAEQGRAEGAPSARWRYGYTNQGLTWVLPYLDADLPAEYRGRYWTGSSTDHDPICRTCRLFNGKWALWWRLGRQEPTVHDTARAAMIAAKEGA